MSRPTILLIGANGQVGFALQTALSHMGEVVACTRAELDLGEVATKPHLISDLVQAIRPSVIVNASAYTAVDKAESETEQARTLNAVVPGLLAQAANEVGACMVHYSTDYVFDGTKKGSYQEQDQTNPLSVYGQTKLQGEQAVAKACARHLIMRTSWVVSAHGGNFLKTMLRLGLERDHLRVVADQIGAPTSAKLIAQTTSQLLETMLLAPGTDPRWGLYHLTASGQTSWFYYAQYVLSHARARGWPIKVADDNIEAIATADYPVAAPRPHNSKLNTSKIRQTFNVVLPDWTEGVDDVLAELFKQYSASSQESPQGLSR
ncbi:MAG: dTDP-4-dehydrorhamnose reductase [Sheuella sp.]|nr:dTDP-4-dehydrorhamnose reductase [Sheuella sp.]